MDTHTIVISNKFYKEVEDDTNIKIDANTSVRGVVRPITHKNQKIEFKFCTLKTNSKEDFLLPTKKNRFLCIKEECKGCPLISECTLTKETYPYFAQVVVIDISAQEPLLASLVHREPLWITTQRNKQLRKNGMDIYLNEIAKEKWGVTLEPSAISLEDFDYYSFLQHIEDDDNLLKALMVFNDLGDKGIIGEREINWWLNKFEEFKSNLKGRSR